MPSITYSITVSPVDTIFKGGAKFSATMTRSSTPPPNAKPKSAVVKFTDIRVWSNNSPYIVFEDYFTTQGLPNTSGHYLEVGCSSLSQGILGVSSVDIEATVKGVTSSVNAFDFNSSSVTLVVEYEEQGSTSGASSTSSSVVAGGTSTVSFSNSNLSNVYHVVKWSIGTHSNSVQTSYGASSASSTIPQDWLNAIPNSDSGLVTISVSTYSAAGFLGSTSTSVTMTVPDSVKPTISGLTASRINNNVPSGWGIYLQNHSGVTLTANGAAGAYGSEISSYTFTEGYSNTQTGNVATIPTLTSSGTITFSVYATDTRGRKSNTASVSISVTPYSTPSIASLQAFRCNSAGSSNDSGTYINAQYTATYNSIGGKNSITATIYYQRTGASAWTTGKTSAAQNTAYVIGAGGVSTEYSYQVKVVISDAQTTIERIVPLMTSTWSMFFKKGGTGVGFGQECFNNYSLEINPSWKIRYGNFQLLPAVVSNDPPSNPVEGLIWLCPV